MVRAVKDVGPHHDEIGADPRFEFFSRKVGKNVGARNASKDSWDTKFEKEGFVDVLVEEMADATHPCRKDFRDFDAVADESGGGAKSQEK